MRITAGRNRSRALKTLKSDISRPTTDKVRQAIYSRIGPYFDGDVMLDVFAGSGAMGFEALSRGMGHVMAIEVNRQAYQLIQENAKALNEEAQISLILGDALKVVSGLNQTFDYVFIDPPYAYPHFETIIKVVIQSCVKPNTTIIVESDTTLKLPELILGFECIHQKKYGNTMIRYYEMSDTIGN